MDEYQLWNHIKSKVVTFYREKASIRQFSPKFLKYFKIFHANLLPSNTLLCIVWIVYRNLTRRSSMNPFALVILLSLLKQSIELWLKCTQTHWIYSIPAENSLIVHHSLGLKNSLTLIWLFSDFGYWIFDESDRFLLTNVEICCIQNWLGIRHQNELRI